MERIQQKAGVPAIVAVVAVFVLLYSLWGASVLRSQAASADRANTVAANS